MLRFLKKTASLFCSAVAVVLISGFLHLDPVADDAAQASAPSSCADISGIAGEVLSRGIGRLAGVADSGRIDFDVDPPHGNYGACKEASGSLEGWAMNINVGLVSFRCDASGENLSAPCGRFPYQTIVTPPVAGDLQVKGFAWNDSIGWLSMHCDGGKNIAAGDCGNATTFYEGVRIARQDETISGCGSLRAGDFYGYAWNENVGWVSFCGAHVSLEPPIQPSVTFTRAAAGSSATGLSTYANGTDAYTIAVGFTENGRVLAEAEIDSHGIRVTDLEWQNSLRADQVTRCTPVNSADSGETLPSCEYNGAILPEDSDFAWDAAVSGLSAKVRTVAPTGPHDTLLLNSFTVQMDGQDYELNYCPDRDAFLFDAACSGTKSFAFEPAVQVDKFASLEGGTPDALGNNVLAIRSSDTPHKIEVSSHRGGSDWPADSDIRVITQLHNCSDDFTLSISGQTAGAADANDLKNIDLPGAVCADATRTETIADISHDDDAFDNGLPLEAFMAGAAESGSKELNIHAEPVPGGITEVVKQQALGIRTRVEYPFGSTNVRYFSLSVADGSILNQSAKVEGNVRIATGESVLGNKSRTIGDRVGGGREVLLRAMQKLAAKNWTTSQVVELNALPSDNNAFFYRRPQTAPSGETGEPCRIIIGQENSPFAVSGNRTIASVGCDIYLRSNIRPAAAGGKLGIIALQDLKMQGSRKGGFVYICSNVTDLENVHISTDRSIFSIGASASSCGDPARVAGLTNLIDRGTGLPTFLPSELRNILKNQLAITGSVRSNNTDGASLSAEPKDGEGQPVNARTARLYDINFLRYAKVDSTGGCYADDVGLSQKFVSTLPSTAAPTMICGVDNPALHPPVTVIFQELAGLPVFEEGARR